jgi:hypothetical protein
MGEALQARKGRSRALVTEQRGQVRVVAQLEGENLFGAHLVPFK